MPSSEVHEELRHIAQTEFRDVVTLAAIAQLESGVPRKLRLRIVDGSYVDIFVSPSGRYSYHWERTVGDTKFVYRHDNAPHAAWKHVTTFPKHFHDGTEDYVVPATSAANHSRHCASSAALAAASCALSFPRSETCHADILT
jgi:hypothetical protein